jgi:hypothetical protein
VKDQDKTHRITGVILINLACQMSVDFVSREHAVPRKGPKGIERRGLYARDLECDETRRWRTQHTVELNGRQRGTPIFTQVQGPRGEVKPLLPAFLYCDAIPREEYKVLVTKL